MHAPAPSHPRSRSLALSNFTAALTCLHRYTGAVVLGGNFTAALTAALAELPSDWDVLLLGALGAVHPKYYGINVLHAVMAGGMHWPKWLSESIHTPLRPFGTHAYVISERGAKKLLAAAPRASYHVDVVAWGVSNLRLFAVHPLLAKQTHGDTTIGMSRKPTRREPMR